MVSADPIMFAPTPKLRAPCAPVPTVHTSTDRQSTFQVHTTASYKPHPERLLPSADLTGPAYLYASQVDGNQSIMDAIAKVAQLQRLPQAKPETFRGDDRDKTRFFLWETAFDALVDSAPVTPQQKLYLLYQHLDGKAKKVVEQLQFMVNQPETAYQEARRMLKHRFRHPAILYTDFENKLTNWPKIANNDPQGMQEFSDFLNQDKVASQHISNLRIFEYPSKIQALVDKLPGWFKTKWSSMVQTLQQEKGFDAFPTFASFIREVTFHAERMNIPQINHNTIASNAPSRATTNYVTPSTHPRRNPVTTLVTRIQTSREPKGQGNQHESETVCKYHGSKTHPLTSCQKFQDLNYQQRKEFLFKNRVCFNCTNTDKHVSRYCNQPSPACDICQGKTLNHTSKTS